MSLQTFRPEDRGKVTYTYESLHQALSEFTRNQLERTKTVVGELEEQIDFSKFTRVMRTQADNKKKYDRFQAGFTQLYKEDQDHPQIEDIRDLLSKAKTDIDALNKKIKPIEVRQNEAEEQRKAAEEKKRLEQQAQQQISEERMAQMVLHAQTEMIENNLGDIVEQMQDLKETNDKVTKVIAASQNDVVRADNDMQDAVEIMEEAIEDVNKAEEHQKAAGCCNVC